MLLDESSSMFQHQMSVVSSFNEYVTKLRKDTKRCWLSLFKFSDTSMFNNETFDGSIMTEVFENRNVKEIYPMVGNQYQPNGWTPLYDAIGKLILKTKKRLPKDAKVLFIVHTDGQENRSKEFNQERVKTLIKRMEKKRGWTFVYLGEGAEAWNAGHDFGIDNVANFSSSMRGASMDKLATATTCYASNAGVGGQAGATQSFYGDANLKADDISDDDDSSYSSSVTNADQDSQLKTTDD